MTDQNSNNLATGLRAGSSFTGSIIAGIIIGYGLDYWLSTSPIFLIIFCPVGIAAGFYNLWRVFKQLDKSNKE